MLSGQSLNIANLSRFSASDDSFEQIIHKLNEDYFGDREAIDLTAAYKEQIALTLTKSNRNLSLKKIACGLSVCAAQMEGEQLAQLEFVDILMNSNAKNTTIYSSDIKIAPPEPGFPTTRYRVIFSTDPAANKLVVKPKT